MKKIIATVFIFSFSLSCIKKTTDADPAPVETVCLVQKINRDGGIYEVYKFDANKKLSEAILTYDDNGKIVEWPVKFEYNAQGNLLKTTSTLDGSTDNYIYDSGGLLTRVDFKDKAGVLTEQFTVTMDSQKRLTKVITKEGGLTGVYEYNGQDNALSKVEVSYLGKVMDLYTIQTWVTDKTKKGYDVAITGHPFDPTVFTGDMVYYPFNIKPNQGLAETGIASTSYDEKWEKITPNLRIYYAFKATRKYNSNNFAIERIANDAVTKKSFTTTLNYSNCN